MLYHPNRAASPSGPSRSLVGRRIAILTVLFCGAYFGIRALPVEQCDILHYRDYMTADGVIEQCGIGEAIFFDMQSVRYPVRADLEALDPVRAGETARFLLSLSNSRGDPIHPDEIAVSHTERIHLMAIDPGLEDYHHVHPQPTATPGHYSFSITPQFSGTYAIYLDFIPMRAGRRALARLEVDVAGGRTASPVRRVRTATEKNGIRFHLESPAETLTAGVEHRLSMRAERVGSPAPVRFEPVMGAFAHLVVFDEAARGFAHLHPSNPFLDEQDPHNPDLDFSFQPDRAGHYRIWAQVKVDGAEVYVPFDVIAEARRRS